jgi:hypothetical protein
VSAEAGFGAGRAGPLRIPNPLRWGNDQVRRNDVVEVRVTLPDCVFAETLTVPLGVASVIGNVPTALPVVSV